MTTTSKKLADEYLRLGGHRLAKVDDSNVTTRQWGKDSPEAEAFWETNIAPLSAKERRDVEIHLPSISDR